MEHRTSRRSDNPPKEWINPAELRALLERLHAEDAEPEPDDDHTTVAAVCEATGEDEKRVWELLETLRREDLEERISRRLAEAEEPLYRVERPGTSQDPLSRKTWVGQQRAITTVLDHLPRPNRPKLSKKKHADTKTDRVALLLSIFFLLAVLAVVAMIIARALAKGSI
jgi:hypothetical protein